MPRPHVEVAEVLLSLLVTLSSHPTKRGISPGSRLAEKIAVGFIAIGVYDYAALVYSSCDGAKRIGEVVGSDSRCALTDNVSFYAVVICHCHIAVPVRTKLNYNKLQLS